MEPGRLCGGVVKANILPNISQNTDILCRNLGAFAGRIFDHTDLEEQKLSWPCSDLPLQHVHAVKIITSDGGIMSPTVDNVGTDCPLAYNHTQALDNGCWPFYQVLKYNVVKDMVFNQDETTEGSTITVSNCDIMTFYITAVKSMLLTVESVTNMHVIGLFDIPHEESKNAANELNTLTCNGVPMFPTSDNSDNFSLYILLGVVFVLFIGISITCFRMVSRNRSQKRSKREMRMQMERDRIRLSEASRMMAWINHELRNILNGVMGLSMFARDYLKEAQSQPSLRQAKELISNASKDITTVVESCQLMTIMVNDVMKLRQLEEGKLSSTKTPTNVCKLVNSVLKVFRPKFNEKPNVKIKVHTFENAADEEFLIDAIHVMQVLANYVGNSIKFTDSGSIRIILKKLGSGKSIRFEVHDTGTGIPSSLQSSVFKQRWVQGDTKEKVQGSGFGLFLCHGLVTKVMHGQIGFETVVGIGSMFWFEVPVGSTPGIDISQTFANLDANDISSSGTVASSSIATIANGQISRRIGHTGLLGGRKPSPHISSNGSGNSKNSITKKMTVKRPSGNKSKKFGFRRKVASVVFPQRNATSSSIKRERIKSGKRNQTQMSDRDLVFRTRKSADSLGALECDDEYENKRHTLRTGQTRVDGMSILRYGDATQASHHHHQQHKFVSQTEATDDHKCLESACFSSTMSPSLTASPIKSPIISPGISALNNNDSTTSDSSRSVLSKNILINPKGKYKFGHTNNTGSIIGRLSSDVNLSNSNSGVTSGDKHAKESLVELFAGRFEKSDMQDAFVNKSSSSNQNADRAATASRTRSFEFKPSCSSPDLILPQMDALPGLQTNKDGMERSFTDSSMRHPFDKRYIRANLSPGKIRIKSRSNSTEVHCSTPTNLNPTNIGINTSTSNSTFTQSSGPSSAKFDLSPLAVSPSAENMLNDAAPTENKASGDMINKAKEAEKGELEGYTVLIVDDSPINRLILRRVISNGGGTVIEACDGQQAIDKWTANKEICLIWMDVIMPVMNGTTASTNLRQLGCTCPIIACTGNVQEEDQRKCLQSGMDRLEAKPLNVAKALKVSSYFIKLAESRSRKRN
eukprot:TRINITY_DN1729_c0_g1_i4.p1 TRINITY_DN1729_c0_g1~~TRINITY_DN1729_c0_g1_i4.p1  ORF type:complete len:1092 (-),score=270.33 TRINITY_DN1729_c0_g1_i4:251-3526(-)